jgi:surfactin synthase thioesterase subunit
MGGTVGNILQQPKWRQYIFPTLRADLEVSDLYSYYSELPIDCPLGVFGGTDDQTVTPPEWQAWQQHFTQTITVQELPGKHFFDKEGQEKLIKEVVVFCFDNLPLKNIKSIQL